MVKKSPARLQREIDEALSSKKTRSHASTRLDPKTKRVRFSVPIVGPRGQVAPPALGFVRLYRGGARGGLEDVMSPTHGRWFTTMLSSAKDYAGVIDDGSLPPGTVILVVDVHGDDVARMPTTRLSMEGYAPIPLPKDDQAWLRDRNLLQEVGPPDVEIQVPSVVARAAARLLGRARAVTRAKPH